MSDQPRPVWLTREQRDLLASILNPGPLGVVVDAWDAAPVDAVEAVRSVFRDWYGVPVSGVQVDAVLLALGMPQQYRYSLTEGLA